MDFMVLFKGVFAIALTAFCYAVLLVLLIKYRSKIPPKGSVAISGTELMKLKDDAAKRNLIALRYEQESNKLKAETSAAKEELAKARQELALKEKDLSWAAKDSEKIKLLNAENEKLKEEMARAMADIAKLSRKDEEAAALSARIAELEAQARAVSTAADAAVAAADITGKDAQIAALKADLAKLQSDYDASSARQLDLEVKIQELSKAGEASAKKEPEPAVGAVKPEDLEAKEQEIIRLKAELENLKTLQNAYAERASKLKDAEAGIEALETSLHEEKKTAHELSLRIQEIRMKIRLLNDKSKEAAEEIAAFAQGKEFDEFRKSVHMDELVQKYEDEIRQLKMKSMGK